MLVMSVILKSRCLVACLFWLVTVTQSILAMSGCLHKHFLKQALQSLRWTQSRWRVKQEEMKWFSARGWALISWEALSNQTDERWRRGFSCRIGVCCVTDSRGMRPAAFVVAVKGRESNQTHLNSTFSLTSCSASTANSQNTLFPVKMSHCRSKMPVVLNLIPISFWFVRNTCDILLKA